MLVCAASAGRPPPPGFVLNTLAPPGREKPDEPHRPEKVGGFQDGVQPIACEHHADTQQPAHPLLQTRHVVGVPHIAMGVIESQGAPAADAGILLGELDFLLDQFTVALQPVALDAVGDIDIVGE